MPRNLKTKPRRTEMKVMMIKASNQQKALWLILLGLWTLKQRDIWFKHKVREGGQGDAVP